MGAKAKAWRRNNIKFKMKNISYKLYIVNGKLYKKISGFI